jgi:hypothetical protein
MTDQIQKESSLVDYVLANRLKVIGYTWLTGVGGSMVSLRC